MKKLDKKWAIFITLSVVIVIFTAFLVVNQFKITDPADPRFDPMKFKFEDYKTEEDLYSALSILLPKGTPRKNVEELLEDYGRAKSSQKRNFMNKKTPTSEGYLIVYGKIWNKKNLKTVWVNYQNHDELFNLSVQYMKSKEAIPYIFMTGLAQPGRPE